MEKNKKIQKAGFVLELMTKEEELRRMAELEEKWELDRISLQYDAKQEGIEEGLKEGTKKGRKEEKIEIAKNMLNKKLDINLIIELTGLSKEEIENL